MEEEMSRHAAQIEEKNLMIQKQQQKIENFEKTMASGQLMAVKSLDGMADLEAKLAFVTNEKNELNQELVEVKANKTAQI